MKRESCKSRLINQKNGHSQRETYKASNTKEHNQEKVNPKKSRMEESTARNRYWERKKQ